MQTRVDVRPLSEYEIRVDELAGKLAVPVQRRLDELGLTHEPGKCTESKRRITYYQENSKQAASLLASALDEVMPDPELRYLDFTGRDRILWICLNR